MVGKFTGTIIILGIALLFFAIQAVQTNAIFWQCPEPPCYEDGDCEPGEFCDGLDCPTGSSMCDPAPDYVCPSVQVSNPYCCQAGTIWWCSMSMTQPTISYSIGNCNSEGCRLNFASTDVTQVCGNNALYDTLPMYDVNLTPTSGSSNDYYGDNSGLCDISGGINNGLCGNGFGKTREVHFENFNDDGIYSATSDYLSERFMDHTVGANGRVSATNPEGFSIVSSNLDPTLGQIEVGERRAGGADGTDWDVNELITFKPKYCDTSSQCLHLTQPDVCVDEDTKYQATKICAKRSGDTKAATYVCDVSHEGETFTSENGAEFCCTGGVWDDSGPCMPAVSQDGLCGNNAQNYAYDETSYPNDDFCTEGELYHGSFGFPDFPSQGGSSDWECRGTNGGITVDCTATRDSPPGCTESDYWQTNPWPGDFDDTASYLDNPTPTGTESVCCDTSTLCAYGSDCYNLGAQLTSDRVCGKLGTQTKGHRYICSLRNDGKILNVNGHSYCCKSGTGFISPSDSHCGGVADPCDGVPCGIDGDGCCPAGCTPAEDSDCSSCSSNSDCPDPAGACNYPLCSGGTCTSGSMTCTSTPYSCDSPPDSYSRLTSWCDNDPGCAYSTSTSDCPSGFACNSATGNSCQDCDGDNDGYVPTGASANCIFLADSGLNGMHPGRDCNDADATVYPGAPENTLALCSDGKSNDCNSWEADYDGYTKSPITGNSRVEAYEGSIRHGKNTCAVYMDDIRIEGSGGASITLDTPSTCEEIIDVQCILSSPSGLNYDLQTVELVAPGVSCWSTNRVGDVYNYQCIRPGDTDGGSPYQFTCTVRSNTWAGTPPSSYLGRAEGMTLNVACNTTVQGEVTAAASSSIFGISVGDPVQNALVRFGSRFATTGSDGTYSLPAVPVDTYEPVVSAENFDAKVFSEPPFVLGATPDPTTGVDFQIYPAECTETCSLLDKCDYDVCEGQNNCNLNTFSPDDQALIKFHCQDADPGSVFRLDDGRFVRCCGPGGTVILDEDQVQTDLTLEACSPDLVPHTRLIEYNGRVHRLVVMTYGTCE